MTPPTHPNCRCALTPSSHDAEDLLTLASVIEKRVRVYNLSDVDVARVATALKFERCDPGLKFRLLLEDALLERVVEALW